MEDVCGDRDAEVAALLAKEKIEPVDDQVVVLGESDSRTPAVPTCGTAPRVERGSEQTDDDELSLGHSLLAHFLYHGIGQRRRCVENHGESQRTVVGISHA